MTAPRLLEIGEWLTDTTRSMVHGFGDFFAVLTLVCLGSTAISAPLLWMGSRDVVITRDDNGVLGAAEGMTGGQGVMVAIGIVVIMVAQVLLFAAATVHIDRVRRGDRPRWAESLGAIARRGPRVVGVVAQVVAVALVLLIAASSLGAVVGLGSLGGLVAFVGAAFLWIRSAVAGTHAALGGVGGAIAHSVRWTRGLTWPLLGRHILLASLAIGLLLIGSLFAAPFQSLSGATPATDGDLVMRDALGNSVAAFVGVQFINALVLGVTAALWASAMLSIYRGEPAER